MDTGVYRVSLIFILFGVVGIWLADFANISESFKELSGISALLLVFGLVLLPVALFKGGFPPRRYYAPVGLVILLGLGLIGVPFFFPTGPQVVESGKVVNVYIVANEWAFNESNPTITVHLGDKVHITYFNNGSVPHDFTVLDMPDAETGIIIPGATIEIEFLAVKTGEFDYICSIPGHADLGMRGKFIVLPPSS